MNKKSFFTLVVVVIAVITIGLALNYWSQKPVAVQPATTQSAASSTVATSTPQQAIVLPPFSFSCPQSSTTAYEDPKMGIAFCYPSNLTVATNSISWPATSGIRGGQISFWILHEPFTDVDTISATTPGRLFSDLAACDASGSNGESWCAFPTPTQLVEGKNSNGFAYVFFRHNIDYSRSGEGYGTTTVYQYNAGPSAFVPLIGQNYLAFAITNSLFQGAGFGSLPTSTDNDLKEILDTVSIMPQRYTGVGLTVTRNSAGGLSVYNVIASSSASVAGIKAGDILTELNGTSTENMSVDDATNFLYTATGTIVVGVEEGNASQPKSISLTPTLFVVSGSDLGSIYQKPF